MYDDNPAIRLGPDSAESVIGELAPTIHALEAEHGCEITVEVKAEALWLVLSGFPLPPGGPSPGVAISLVWNGDTVSLYLQRDHALTRAWARSQPALLQPPLGLQWEGVGAKAAEHSPEDLWRQGWTRWCVNVPKPTVGSSFNTLINWFANELKPAPASPAPASPLTDMDRVRQGMQPPPPPLPAPPITSAELFHALSKTVHSQEQALRAVSGEVVIHLAKEAPERPAVLLAVGPTGVGKTRTAEAIAPALNALRPEADPPWTTVRINLSEYKEAHRVSQLLGAPAGYLGYGEKSQLVQALSVSSRCVLVFDEFEKAHPELIEVLMTALDEGVFTTPQAINANGADRPTAQGKEDPATPTHQLSCKESIFVFTSNLDQAGMLSEYQEDKHPIDIETAIRMRLLSAGIKPENVTRLGRCVVFLPIAEADRAEIVLSTVGETAREFGLEVKHVCPELVIEVLRRAPTKTFGARAERRTVSWLMGEAFVQAVRDGLHEVRVLSNPTRCEAWTPATA